MKKLIFLVSLLAGTIGLSAQNVVIQQNGTNTKDSEPTDNQYYINGISMREDIGGVEISRGPYFMSDKYRLTVKNYNNFPVTVIYEVDSNITGNIVLQANEEKHTATYYYEPTSFKTITRRFNNNNTSNTTAQSNNNLTTLFGILTIFPEDIKLPESDDSEYQSSFLVKTIYTLNNNNAYGRNNWRFPTEEEFALMKQFINLSKYCYIVDNDKLHLIFLQENKNDKPEMFFRLVSPNY